MPFAFFVEENNGNTVLVISLQYFDVNFLFYIMFLAYNIQEVRGNKCINPIGYGPKQQFLKMSSSIVAHRNVQTEWKFVRIIICIYRSDYNRKNSKQSFDWQR